jgi:hypothetical protein
MRPMRAFPTDDTACDGYSAYLPQGKRCSRLS